MESDVMGMLEGKVAIVTGGSQGIGRGCVERFVREGAAVVIGDVRDEAGHGLVQSCGTSGGRVVFHHADVSIGTDFKALVDRAIKEYGRLDILLNNAAVAGPYGPIEQVPEEDWDLCIGITPRSVFLGMKYAIPQLRGSGGGAIISIASGAAIRSEPFLHAYSAAKAAIVNLSQGGGGNCRTGPHPRQLHLSGMDHHAVGLPQHARRRGGGQEDGTQGAAHTKGGRSRRYRRAGGFSGQ
jgi:NAD(P)-dependent dehydrogenase (short-subunit alcohol dehydrogenase family)